jgi:DNA-binding transcriptional ArsR family regulator
VDALIATAARALAAGDPLGALKRIALREEAPALALRGIAMAQLGELARAKMLLRRAARAFGPNDVVARARCTVAEAEIALVSRDLGWSQKALDTARVALAAHGDRVNAAHARYLETRRLLLIGRLDEAERTLATVDPSGLPPASRTAHALVLAGIAMRRLRTETARTALARAREAAREARIPALAAEVERALAVLQAPAARLFTGGEARVLRLEEVEALFASRSFVVDACRHVVRVGQKVVSLAKRPVLFALVRALGEAWPEDVPREVLVARAFGLRLAHASHRGRLRVEMARLRTALRALAEVRATMRGFALLPRSAPQASPGGHDRVVVLARPVEVDVDKEHATVLAFLADGESWSSSALALALGASQRTVQRALDALAERGKVEAFGHGRTLRWMTPPMPGVTTTLLLPAPLPAT